MRQNRSQRLEVQFLLKDMSQKRPFSFQVLDVRNFTQARNRRKREKGLAVGISRQGGLSIQAIEDIAKDP